MKQDLEKEWIQLMVSAKEQGLTKEEVREFLRQNQKDGKVASIS